MRNVVRNILFYIFIIGFMGIALIYNINKPLILIIHSYKEDYSWTRDVDKGLTKILDSSGGYNLRWHYMDTKNHPSEEDKNRAGRLTRRVIDEIKPNIIIAIDDDAQQYVARHYIDAPGINIIFAGVNATLETYGYEKAKNATGILERLPLKGIKNVIEEIRLHNPHIRETRIMHLSDDSNTVQADDASIHKFSSEWGKVELRPSVLVHTFQGWKRAVAQAPKEATFLLISNYRKIYDEAGKLVPPHEVMEWTIANSKIPVIGVNAFTVEDGALFAIATSPFEQGEVAAKMALKILRDKIEPKNIPVMQTKQFIVCMRGTFNLKLPPIYESFARVIDRYWEK